MFSGPERRFKGQGILRDRPIRSDCEGNKIIHSRYEIGRVLIVDFAMEPLMSEDK